MLRIATQAQLVARLLGPVRSVAALPRRSETIVQHRCQPRGSRQFQGRLGFGQTQQQAVGHLPAGQLFENIGRPAAVEQEVAPGSKQIAVVATESQGLAVVPFGLIRLAAPGRHFAKARQQPEAVAGIAGVRQSMLQGPVAGLELAAIGLGQPETGAEQGAAVQAPQRIAFTLRRHIICLNQIDRTAPGMGVGETGIEFQRRGKVTQGAVEVVSILAQKAAREAQ